MHEPKKSELHAGELKAFEPESDEVFEFGGHKLLIRGTSGPPATRARMAEGKPTRHDVTIASPGTSARGTSGASQVERRMAEGQPVHHRPAAQDAAPGSKGSGQMIGGPVRRA